MRASAKVISVLLFAPALLSSPARSRAQETRPYSLEQIEGLLEARLSPAVILDMVRSDCLAFLIDKESERRLSSAGATEDLVDALREVCYRTPMESPDQPGASNSQLPFDPGSSALRSLAIPGLGQFHTGRPAAGAVFVAAWAGAIGFGVLSQEVTVECLAQTTGPCPAGQVRAELTERPMLPVGLGAAVAIAVISALEARSGARKANSRRVGFAGGNNAPGVVLEFLPEQSRSFSRAGGSGTRFVLLQLRHR